MNSYIIHYERSGGFAGLTQTFDLKSDTLSTEDQSYLSKLLDTSGFFELKKGTRSGAPDQFIYTLTVKTDGKENTVEIGEADMPDKLRPLINFLTGQMKSP